MPCPFSCENLIIYIHAAKKDTPHLYIIHFLPSSLWSLSLFLNSYLYLIRCSTSLYIYYIHSNSFFNSFIFCIKQALLILREFLIMQLHVPNSSARKSNYAKLFKNLQISIFFSFSFCPLFFYRVEPPQRKVIYKENNLEYWHAVRYAVQPF